MGLEELRLMVQSFDEPMVADTRRRLAPWLKLMIGLQTAKPCARVHESSMILVRSGVGTKAGNREGGDAYCGFASFQISRARTLDAGILGMGAGEIV